MSYDDAEDSALTILGFIALAPFRLLGLLFYCLWRLLLLPFALPIYLWHEVGALRWEIQRRKGKKR